MHPENAFLHISVTLFGIDIYESDIHRLNIFSSILEILFDNFIFFSDEHLSKAFLPISATLSGIVIFVYPLKVPFSIFVILFGIITFKRDKQYENVYSPFFLKTVWN